jgi:hypothetical protein
MSNVARSIVVVGLASVPLLLGSCASGRPAQALTPLTAVTATTEPAPPVVDEVPESTSLADLVEDCVAVVPVGAYLGNALLADMWRHALEDVTALRRNCEDLGTSNVDALRSLSRVWHDLESALAARAPLVAPPDGRADFD